MLNDRDEKYEGQEESEYHFSDDEVSYEMESEPTSPTAKPAVTPTSKLNFLNRLSTSRRMVISLVVFLVLVFIVYKMVTPTASTPPATDITSPKVTAQTTPLTKTPPAAATARTVPEAPAAPTSNVIPIEHPAAPATAAVPTQPPIIEKPVVPTTPPVAAPPPTVATTPVVPQQTTVVKTEPATTVIQHTAQTPPTVMPGATTVEPSAPTVQMPSQNPAEATPTPQVVITATPQISNPEINARIANMASENEKLMNQMQLDYTQKLNSFMVQSKTMQDQLHNLNLRVASMENQMNQLVKVLTNQVSPPKVGPSIEPEGPPPTVSSAKINYTVQAIIPGRAWLKAGNGETLTVAEGDMIRGVGRVTKIDPYDGVVEINTGNKVVSLSYGSGE